MLPVTGPPPPAPRSSYLEWNYPAELFAFSARLGESVDELLLRQVFTERSYLQQQRLERERLGLPDKQTETADNGGLAERGLALMASCASGWLRAALPRMPEEGIQAVTSHLTSHSQLLELAYSIGMKDLVLAEEHPPSEEALVRCLQAFVATLAEGAEEARAQLFVRDFVLSRLDTVDLNAAWQIEEPLALLTEVLDRCGRGLPEPRLLRSAGPETLLASHIVGIYSDKKLLASAPGDTVSEATQLAARTGLNKLMGVTESSAPLDLLAERAPVTSPAAALAEWRPL